MVVDFTGNMAVEVSDKEDTKENTNRLPKCPIRNYSIIKNVKEGIAEVKRQLREDVIHLQVHSNPMCDLLEKRHLIDDSI